MLKNKDLFFNKKKLKYPTNVFTTLFFNIKNIINSYQKYSKNAHKTYERIKRILAKAICVQLTCMMQNNFYHSIITYKNLCKSGHKSYTCILKIHFDSYKTTKKWCIVLITPYGEMVYTLFISYMARDNILINIH